ncbi:MAG: multifunctional 2',3'-cyclic-nucleotide 2'-phosphodiesterase/5'-nucleotidase/3'-nucleotidase [Clostridiaceae bacterium]|nr:multifunctional 2',3'-cyclic-nucleotide 2'-phosphodiesterase/5'-nucleotidase/3'-nucleotidase [Clostridiaceae bacterium]
MNKKWIKRATGLLLALVMVFTIMPLTVNAQAEKELIILHTNDVHGSAEADDKHIGYANYKNVIEDYKAKNDHVLVVDAGDASMGTTFASLTEGADVITVLNMLPLDAFTPGNHEFDYSQESAMKNYADSDFPWYASNVTYESTGELVFDAGEVLDIGGLMVGIFGLATPETKFKADPRNTEGLNFADTVAANVAIAEDEVERLKNDGAEIIVLLSHLGTDLESDVKATDIAAAVEGIDIIIDGHSHSPHSESGPSGHSFIASGADGLLNIGLATVSTSGKVTSNVITKAEAVEYGKDEQLDALIEGILEEQEEVLGIVIGKTALELDGARETNRTGETNLGNLITDAMLDASGADVVLTNGGGFRATIEAGEITVKDIFTVLPFGNAMTVIKVTGQDIIDALNHGTKAYPEPAGGFPHVSGMTYEIAVGYGSIPNMVTNVKIAGEPLVKTKEYTLASNDFMAVGGDDYTMFKGKEQTALYGLMADIVRDYIIELEKEAGEEGFTYEIEGRITIYETAFKDAPLGHWAHEYVETLYEEDIVKGYGTSGEFRPDNKVIRGHAAKMIAIAAGLDYDGLKADFSDVAEDYEMSPFIAALVEKGAVKGYDDDTYRPEENIKRSHLAKVVVKVFGLEMGEEDVELTDIADNSEKEYIEILASNGLVKGYGDTKEFRPDRTISRAELAKILALAMDLQAVPGT